MLSPILYTDTDTRALDELEQWPVGTLFVEHRPDQRYKTTKDVVYVIVPDGFAVRVSGQYPGEVFVLKHFVDHYDISILGVTHEV